MTEPTAGGRIRVLVAEDEENLAQILCTFLRGRGHYVVCVGDGKAALQAVRDESFDVALIDIVMPEMDGLETLKHLRAEADPPQVHVDVEVLQPQPGAEDGISGLTLFAGDSV